VFEARAPVRWSFSGRSLAIIPAPKGEQEGKASVATLLSYDDVGVGWRGGE